MHVLMLAKFITIENGHASGVTVFGNSELIDYD